MTDNTTNNISIADEPTTSSQYPTIRNKNGTDLEIIELDTNNESKNLDEIIELDTKNESNNLDEIIVLDTKNESNNLREIIEVDTKKESNNLDEFDDFETPPEPISWSESRPWVKLCIFILFMIISMAVGIIIVCLKTKRITNTTCDKTFQRTVPPQITYDSSPRYVAIGDFNQDNHLDLVIANTGIDNIGIRLGYGNSNFGNQTFYSTGIGSQPYWIGIQDFNNDNLLDIVVANYGTNNIGVFLGNGNGSFTDQMIFSLNASRPVSLAIGDFNNDKQWDIAIVNNGTFYLIILWGSGDGSFEMGTSYFMGYDSMPCSIALADLNRDHRSDIIVVNYGTSELVTLLSNQNGIFSMVRYSTGAGSHPLSVTADYLNNDSYVDLAIVNSATHNVGIFLGYGNGTFPSMQIYPISPLSYPNFIVTGQFNNDTNRDLAVADSNENYIIILIGNGTGLFTIATNQSTGEGSYPCSIAVADLDHDNQSEIIVVNNGINDIYIFSAYTFHTIVNQTSYSTGLDSSPYFAAVADFNNDKHLDIIVCNIGSNDISVFLGLGDGTFPNQQILPMLHDDYAPYALAVGDFNKDKLLDIAVVIPNFDEIDVYFGLGNGSFKFSGSYLLLMNSYPISITVADFNNDKNLDMATANYHSNNLAVLFGSRNGTFSKPSYYNLTVNDSSPGAVAVGDFNDDGFMDLVSANYNSATITILLGNQVGTFPQPSNIDVNNYYPFRIAVGDLNADWQQDIVFPSPDSSLIGILLGNGDGTFQPLITKPTGNGGSPVSVVLGNFNADTITDIAVVDAVESSVILFFGSDNPQLTKQQTIPLGADNFPYCIAIGDFKNNHEAGIIAPNFIGDDITVLTTTYGVGFENQNIYLQGSGQHPYSVTSGDFNNNNQLDIVVANSGRDTIQILIGYQNGTFMKNITYSTGDNSYPRYVITADFNKDNQLDIAVVNYRNQTLMIILNPANETFSRSILYSTGSESFPNSIATGDFNKDGWIDVVVTNSNTDNVGVFLGFDYSTFNTNCTIQFEAGSYPYYVGIYDFNQDSYWDIAVVNQKTNTIDILLGKGDGTFKDGTSYSVDYLSNGISLTIGDFNNDNRLDIAVPNLYISSICIMLGNGDGTFENCTYELKDYYVFFITAGYVNQDGILDLVVVNADNSVSILLGYGNGSFSLYSWYTMPGESSPVWIVIGDFNNDHISDLAVANRQGNNIGILIGIGDGAFKNVTAYSTGNRSAPSSIAIGDFDKDNCVDIAVTNAGTKTVGTFFGYCNGTFSSQVTSAARADAILTKVIVEDFNNDNILDIAITDFGNGNGNIAILYGLGNRQFLIPKIYSTGFSSQVPCIAAKDLNNDGWMDIVVSIPKKDTIVTMLHDNIEILGMQTTFSTGTNSGPSAVAVNDIDKDGQLDLIVANSKTNVVCILLGDGNGNFVIWRTYPTGLNTVPNSIVMGDIDGDQEYDIVVSNSNTDEIGIFFSYDNGTFMSVQTFSTGYGSEPCFVSIGDLNGDNRMDMVIANTGINTVLVLYGTGARTFLKSESYSFSYDDRPRSVAIGDFNNDAWLDIAVANYQSGYVNVLLHTC